jgi:hypothetical protein
MAVSERPGTEAGGPSPKPAWLEKIKQYSVVVVLSFAVSLIVAGADAAKKIHDALEVFGLAHSEALDLADRTAKSDFSDELVRTVSRRCRISLMRWSSSPAASLLNANTSSSEG